MGSAALAAAVLYPDKGARICLEGQRSTNTRASAGRSSGHHSISSSWEQCENQRIVDAPFRKIKLYALRPVKLLTLLTLH